MVDANVGREPGWVSCSAKGSISSAPCQGDLLVCHLKFSRSLGPKLLYILLPVRTAGDFATARF